MHSTTAFTQSYSIASAILFSMFNNDYVQEWGTAYAFYSQAPCLRKGLSCSAQGCTLHVGKESVYDANFGSSTV